MVKVFKKMELKFEKSINSRTCFAIAIVKKMLEKFDLLYLIIEEEHDQMGAHDFNIL